MTPKEQVFADILAELKINGQATVRGFGTFKIKPMNERQARNPRTGESVTVPAHNKLTFKPNKALKETF